MATEWVQDNHTRTFSPGTTISVALASVAAGNLIAVAIHWTSDTITLNSVADDVNGAYTVIHNPTTGTVARSAMAYFQNSAAGTLTITATFSVGPTLAIIVAHEISGAALTSSLDASNMLNLGFVSGGTDNVIVNITLLTAGAYIFGVDFNYSQNGAVTAGTGYTQREQFAGNNGATEDIQAFPSTGSKDILFTDGAGDNHLAGAMAFKPAAEAPTLMGAASM